MTVTGGELSRFSGVFSAVGSLFFSVVNYPRFFVVVVVCVCVVIILCSRFSMVNYPCFCCIFGGEFF